ncbi:hypothetical protein HYW36_02905 [Candidatus Saccharibacteria bacterium]|nr:hypothetical protein [Candidatus Saccharibacteria bacterium]
MRKITGGGLLDALSTCAAKAGLDHRIAGKYSIDELLAEAVQDYFERRYYQQPSSLFFGTKFNPNTFIGSMITEEGLDTYLRWRQSVIDKMASMTISSQRAA